jgi:hypothetical protein
VSLRTATFIVACTRILQAREVRGLYPWLLDLRGGSMTCCRWRTVRRILSVDVSPGECRRGVRGGCAAGDIDAANQEARCSELSLVADCDRCWVTAIDPPQACIVELQCLEPSHDGLVSKRLDRWIADANEAFAIAENAVHKAESLRPSTKDRMHPTTSQATLPHTMARTNWLGFLGPSGVPLDLLFIETRFGY